MLVSYICMDFILNSHFPPSILIRSHFSSTYYSSFKMAGVKRRLHTTDSDIHVLHKELDEVSCAICMDYPHNAVLLMCSSHEKGCRSYICDTSYRHSNCLDRFKKLLSTSSTILSSSLPSIHGSRSSSTTAIANGSVEASEENSNRENNNVTDLETQGENLVDPEPLRENTEETDADHSSESNTTLKCPLCRGSVLGWEVVDEVRKYLNLKRRSCSRDSCSYSGNYQELRRHARRIHPRTRPSDIDPSRERAWRRLEHQREYNDIVSAIQSAIPGSIVVGDYVIENRDRFSSERRENSSGEVGGPWWTTFFLFQMIGSMDSHSHGESRSRRRGWTRHRRHGGVGSDRRLLWGENLLGLNGEEEEDDSDRGMQVFSDEGEDGSPVTRHRRRFVRSRSNEDQP